MISELVRDTNGTEASGRWQPRVLQPGMTLAARYRIRRFLGMGAMGEVHEAEDLLLAKRVALKTLNACSLESERALSRLKREVAAAHVVTHANVCRIFDLGIDCGGETTGPLTFITMEFIEGRTLASLIPDRDVTDEQRTNILRQLAAGLSAAHTSGVIHRDLKPENVMVTRRAEGTVRAVITDFGLAGSEVAAGDAGCGTGLSGTRAYAAPERLRGRAATPASDVYSFGLIASEVLLRRRLVGPQSDLRQLPPAWRSLIARALAVDPAARPKDGGQLVAALDCGRTRGRVLPVALGAASLIAIAVPSLFLAAAAGSTSRRAPEFAAMNRPSDPIDRHIVRAARETASGPVAQPPGISVPKRRAVRRQAAAAPTPAGPSKASEVGLASPAAPAPDRLFRDVAFEPRERPSSGGLLNPF
ncbi:MAG TPA: serine/threonine-protein kinase [Polyangia bacterium]|nr:serine/threonine-protein kinase [Polyangia bacterium]